MSFTDTMKPVRKGRFAEQDWKKQYARKQVSMEEAVRQVRDGDNIAVPGGGSFPQGFEAALGPYAVAENIHASVFSVFTLQVPKMLDEAYKDNVDYYSIFYGQARKKVPQGNVQYIPMNLSKTGDVWLARRPRVVVTTCTPPDENGWMSRTIWGSHIHRDVFDSPDCEVLIAEVNSNYPFLHSDGERHLMLHVSEVDYIVEHDFTWPEVLSIPSTDVEISIAGYVAELIDDGACLQLGQGGLANAIGDNLVHAGKKDIGLQTEVLTNCVAELMRRGVINNSRKQTCRGRSVAGAVVGDKALWDFCHNNPDICMKEIDWVNEPTNVAKNDNVVSINNAMEIDFVGQVCSESIGSRQYTGSGGQLDWVIGSQMSKGGKSIIAMNATYKDKAGNLQSKIKPILSPGAVVTTPRTFVQYVVTEFGVANLRYKSTWERAKALVGIAHPDFREDLMKEAYKLCFS